MKCKIIKISSIKREKEKKKKIVFFLIKTSKITILLLLFIVKFTIMQFLRENIISI
jgi:hypothetical protein